MMVAALAILLLCQLAGEAIVTWCRMPIPGPVIGMLILFGALVALGGVPAAIRSGSDSLLQHLSLLFVPAAVGVLVHLSTFAREWLPILLALLVSTVVTLVVTACTMRWLATRHPARQLRRAA